MSKAARMPSVYALDNDVPIQHIQAVILMQPRHRSHGLTYAEGISWGAAGN